MVSEQNMTQVMMQAAKEPTKAATMVVRETEDHVEMQEQPNQHQDWVDQY